MSPTLNSKRLKEIRETVAACEGEDHEIGLLAEMCRDLLAHVAALDAKIAEKGKR